jgi:GLPGLI family protein
MTNGTEDFFSILIGEDVTYGYSYLYYQLDSLFTAPGGMGIIMESMKKGTMADRYSSGLMRAKLFKDHKTKRLFVIDNISNNEFIYEEDLFAQNWTIRNDTMTISGYKCQKAVCDYRGRSFESWFAPEIPISEGPWKFHGLPGLIIKLFDTKRHYEFELVEFKQSDEKIDIKPLSTKKINVAFQSYKLTKIDRLKFLRIKFGNQGDLLVAADMAKIGLSHEPTERKYGYIELDY